MAEPRGFVVRLLTTDGRTAGVGVLIGARSVLTCAHVVNEALGLDQRSPAQPAEPVTLDFPLLDAAPACTARVGRWLPPPREGAAGDDLALLELTGAAPGGTAPPRLSKSTPAPGRTVDVFGYPGTRPDGSWTPATVRGEVGNGRLQLDAAGDAAQLIQPGYSGSPLVDRDAGRVLGLLSAAPRASSGARDSYGITVDRLLLTWPDLLDAPGSRWSGPARKSGELTILHVSDTQFGGQHLFGGNGLTRADQARDALVHRLHDDLDLLADEHGLRPDLAVVTGDLAEWALPREFEQVADFLERLTEAVGLPRRHVAIVPGNHDVNRKACQSYFLAEEAEERDPLPPYWPKWQQFTRLFKRFYAGVPDISFTPDEPWTLYEMPELSVVVAGLNSTMAESHRDTDHYGWIGEDQLRWFADQLRDFRRRGWLRVGAVHHNAVRRAVLDDENLRDADDLDRILGPELNLLLHGHTHDGRLEGLRSGVPVLSTGSAAVAEHARPREVPNQYQLVTVRRNRLTQHARQYVVGQKRWVGDTRVTRGGSDWRATTKRRFADVESTFPRESHPEPPRRAERAKAEAPDFLDRVREATEVRWPEATVTVCRGYLRVSRPLGGGIEQFPVGVVERGVSAEHVDDFVTQVHARFAAADPQVGSQLVYGGEPAPEALVADARGRGVRLVSFVEYQGMVDLRPLVRRQADRLAGDRLYPAELYVPQRYRLLDQPDPPPRELLDQVVVWLGADTARFVMVLADFGRGKTFLARQLARLLPERLPGLLPILVELRGLEKAPTLDELLAQRLVRDGVEVVEPAKLRYMIRSGRVALLFDGFDELALRVSYDRAADYLTTLLEAVEDRAKVVLTSRTQHFRSEAQVRTALGDRVSAVSGNRIVVIEDFDPGQILQFLVHRYAGDEVRARAHFDLLADVHDLLGLSANPRMLSFITALDESRLREIQTEKGRISASELYRELVDFWLVGEANRQRHERGMTSLDERERLRASTALALKLWTSTAPTIPLTDLGAEVSATLDRLAERGYSEDQAAHAVGSGTLLVRTEDGEFAFVHQSVMEWLVANEATAQLSSGADASVLGARKLSPLMVDFLCDLAGHERALDWAEDVLADGDAGTLAKQNALAVGERLTRETRARARETSALYQTGYPAQSGFGPGATGQPPPEDVDTRPYWPDQRPKRVELAGQDLRDQDLSGANLQGADLRGAVLRGMRMFGTDFFNADLSGADFTGARLTNARLVGANLRDSTWDRAALLGVDLAGPVAESPELRAASITGRDPADVVLPAGGSGRCVSVSPDGASLAMGRGRAVEISDLESGTSLRALVGHSLPVRAVAYSPDGTRLATASEDRTVRIWDPATGHVLGTLTGHLRTVTAVAYSPDGTRLATASEDRTVRIWDPATGLTEFGLTGHDRGVNALTYSPTEELIATASDDGTARIWESRTGRALGTLIVDEDLVNAIAYSPAGTHLATGHGDGTVRIWDAATGDPLVVLTGHGGRVRTIAYAPDGSRLATGSGDGTVRIWETSTGNTLTTLDDKVRALAFSPDGSRLVTASSDRRGRIWDAAAGELLMTLTHHRDPVTGIAFSPDGTRLVTTTDGGEARTWDGSSGAGLAGLAGYSLQSTLAVSPDAATLVVARWGAAESWATATYSPLVPLAGQYGDRSVVAFSPDGSTLASLDAGGRVQVLRRATGIALAAVVDMDAVTALAYSPDSALLATGADDGVIGIWDAATGHRSRTITGDRDTVNALAYSPDGSHLAVASRSGTAWILGVDSGRTVTALSGHTGAVNAVAYVPGGRRIATASDDGTARVWDASTGRALGTLAGHTDRVRAVTYSHDGRRLATGSDDGTVRLWDAATGAALATLIALPEDGWAVLLPDGSYKLEGDPGDAFWWAIKLCRFGPGELDPYVPGIRRLEADARIL